MTVCIGAICEFPGNGGPMVVASSDRMLTMGTTEYQPEQGKFFQFANVPNVIAMVSDNIHNAAAILGAVNRDLIQLQRQSPQTVRGTRLIAEMCADKCAEYQRGLAQREVLNPLGLTHESFLSHQHQLQPDFVRRVVGDITSVSIEVGILIAGQDEEGAHLYVIHDGTLRCNDAIGFAAIGIGANLANSQFTLANYDGGWSMSKALFLLYSARRRAELAPGVGEAADWLAISALATYRLDSVIVDELDKQYKRMRRFEKKTREKIDESLESYMDGYLKTRVIIPTPSGIAPPSSAAISPPPSTPAESDPPPSQGSDESPEPSS